MTTIDAAAAWGVRKPITLASFVAFLAVGLSGCETGSSLLGSAAEAPTNTLAAQPPAPSAQRAKIAIAPVIGAPEAIAKQMQAGLTTALGRQQIGVPASPADKSDYTLRGYIVSAREKAGTKVSYIWDVNDPAGKRVNRITGEEIVPGDQGRDPWAAVSSQVVDAIAAKTAGSLAAWLPTQGAGVPVADNAAVIPATATPPAGATVASSAPAPGTRVAAAGPTTGSIAREGPVSALVPNVTGAPGDGSTALSSALQKELSRNGVTLTSVAADQTYRVEGAVQLGQGKDGKQPIQIDWNVKDPQGKKLGTVSQKNEIPQGSLDGAWGKTADAAAAAAAQGILKLLPQAKSTN